MTHRVKPFVFAVAATLAGFVCDSACADVSLAWKELPNIPDKHGFGGPLVGTHNGALIVAGGANFPDGPPWPEGDRPAGHKVWHDRIFLLLPGDDAWRDAGRLPRPLAYAPVVSIPTGMYVLGGESFDETRQNHDVADVLRLTWNDQQEKLEIEENALPPLPKASSYHGAAAIGNTIFVAASHAKSGKSRRLDEKALWSIDTSAARDRSWISLPPCLGPPRFKMALATAKMPGERGSVYEQLFLFSGGTWVKNEAGEFDLAQFEYYDDAYRFDPATKRWHRLADLPKLVESREIDTTGYRFDKRANAWLPVVDGEQQPSADVRSLFDAKPRPSVAAVAMHDHQRRILLFSGATGRYVTMNVQDRPPFPCEVLAYEVASDRWSVAGRMPLAVVTTGAVWWRDRIAIASGEVRPGVRIRKVLTLQIGERTR